MDGNWIKVEELLPAEEKEVFVTVRYGSADCEDTRYETAKGYRLDDRWWTCTEHDCHVVGEYKGDMNYNMYKGDRVVAWCDIPDPYKPPCICDECWNEGCKNNINLKIEKYDVCLDMYKHPEHWYGLKPEMIED